MPAVLSREDGGDKPRRSPASFFPVTGGVFAGCSSWRTRPMNELFPLPHDPLDAAVRAHLEADGRAANANRVLANALDSLDVRRPRSFRAVLLPLAAAAALFIALFAVSPDHTVRAGPADVVREAQQVHQLA